VLSNLLLHRCLHDVNITTASSCGASAMPGDFAVYTAVASVDDHQPQQTDILQLQYTDVNTKACITASRLVKTVLTCINTCVIVVQRFVHCCKSDATAMQLTLHGVVWHKALLMRKSCICNGI
jgi:hypothetical protein